MIVLARCRVAITNDISIPNMFLLANENVADACPPNSKEHENTKKQKCVLPFLPIEIFLFFFFLFFFFYRCGHACSWQFHHRTAMSACAVRKSRTLAVRARDN